MTKRRKRYNKRLGGIAEQIAYKYGPENVKHLKGKDLKHYRKISADQLCNRSYKEALDLVKYHLRGVI